MPVSFNVQRQQHHNSSKNGKKPAACKPIEPNQKAVKKVRTTSESSPFAQDGKFSTTKPEKSTTKPRSVAFKEDVDDDDEDAAVFLNAKENDHKTLKEAARRHRAKLGRSLSDSLALHEEVMKLYAADAVEVFVVQDDDAKKIRGILKQSSSSFSDDRYYAVDLCDSGELSSCLEILYDEGLSSSSSDSNSDDVALSSSLSSLSVDDNTLLHAAVDDDHTTAANAAAAAELKRVRFAAKPQLQLFRQNASITARSHKNQKKKQSKKKKKKQKQHSGDSVSEEDDGAVFETPSTMTTNKSGLAPKRKRNSSGGSSDNGI